MFSLLPRPLAGAPPRLLPPIRLLAMAAVKLVRPTDQIGPRGQIGPIGPIGPKTARETAIGTIVTRIGVIGIATGTMIIAIAKTAIVAAETGNPQSTNPRNRFPRNRPGRRPTRKA